MLGIEIHRDMFRGLLSLSKKAYVWKDVHLVIRLLLNEIDFLNHTVPRMILHEKLMKQILYASAVDSLMFAQVCTCPDIASAVSVLRRLS